MLLKNCGNRSLYASSGSINHLLNSTSLSLLHATLDLSLRLAQRYHASRNRSPAHAQNNPSLLASHYNINLERVQRVAGSFAKATPPATSPVSPTIKGKEKGQSNAEVGPSMLPADIVGLVKSEDDEEADWEAWQTISMTYYDESSTSQQPEQLASTQSTPSGGRRPSNLGPNALQRRTNSSDDISTPRPSLETPRKTRQQHIEIPAGKVRSTSIEDLLSAYKDSLPADMLQDLLHRLRVAKALGPNVSHREHLVSVRLLAIANLAYVYTESNFNSKIAQPDTEESRRLQLPYQLSELVQPSPDAAHATPIPLQTVALETLEALARTRAKAQDVTLALSINVNHGVLFYVLRKAVAQLSESETTVDYKEEEWREALFSLITGLPTSQQTHRTGEQMVSAGLLSVLVEILTLRTPKAERNQATVLSFLDTFVYNLRDAFTSLVNAKGLDIVADLCEYEVNSALSNARGGDAMPKEFKTQLTDYDIPYFQQQTLRWLFKFVNHMMSHNSGAHDRLLRNLIDSPQLLNGLRVVLSNATVYGSTVWSGAANILSNFIHNEPTSYAVIAEAGLSRALLETVTGSTLPPLDVYSSSAPAEATQPDAEDGSGDAGDGVTEPAPLTFSRPLLAEPAPAGVLPVAEAISAIPHAFGAICLNEKGMSLFKQSGALGKFFDIFTSSAHVKALEVDPDTPTMLGNQFDELVRHHPPLRGDVFLHVMTIVPRVAKLCLDRAEEQGAGAKLWVADKEGQLYVAGGREALAAGFESPFDEGDVDMAEAGGSRNVSMSLDAPYSQVIDEEDSKAGATSLQYVSVACRFLRGFFSNTSLCSDFVSAGGMSYIIDLATVPALPYNFHESMSFGDELSNIIGQLVEQKPYLALPALLHRLDKATDILQPLLLHSKGDAFFALFTDPSKADDLADPKGADVDLAANGTAYLKALLTVHTLCPALATAFQTQLFNHRQTNNFFTQVNLTDIYNKIVDKLGRLQRSCVWEEILLQKHMPEAWELPTRVNSLGLGSEEADNVMHTAGTERLDESTGEVSQPKPALQRQNTNGSYLPPEGDEDSAQFKNTRTLRYLLSRLPTAINPFFQSLGRILLLRRAPESYYKQNAVKVADQLSKAAMDQLRFDLPKHAAEAKDRYAYWIITLTSVTQLMIDTDSMERAYPQVLTLVLQSFKNQGGLAALGDIMEVFVDEVKSIAATHGDEEPQNELGGLFNLALGGLKLVLLFYSRIINGKYVNEAAQTQALAAHWRPDRDRDKPEYFSAGQFLVELRLAVVQQAQRLWNSEAMEKATTSIAKTLIDILRLILDGDLENHALKRSEKVRKKEKHEPRKWEPKFPESLNKLAEEVGDRDLAVEALFRCSDNIEAACQYAKAMKTDIRAIRSPVPPEEIKQSSQAASRDRSASRTQASQATRDNFVAHIRESILSQAHTRDEPSVTSSSVGPDAPILPDFTQDEANLTSIMNAALAQAGGDGNANGDHPLTLAEESGNPDESSINVATGPPAITADDLNDERANLRKNLIDRSLDVLNVHSEVTFELADLIAAATSKAPDQATWRKDIGDRLIACLISFQTEDDLRPQGKKIGAYAHLLALVINNDKQDFYTASLEELQENMETILGFIKVYPDQSAEDTPGWIGQVLLIIEKMLSQDCLPYEIKWKMPEEGKPADETVAEAPAPAVSPDEKIQLFDAILAVLSKVGKDDALALSILRILVILTRERELAVRMAEKRNLSKLFSMMKQIANQTNERIQGSFMIILRHIVEDDETIRRTMQSEIQTLFEARNSRQLDTTSFPRAVYHLVIRSPKIFLEVVNEKLEIPRLDTSSGANLRPQPLQLKKTKDEPGTKLEPVKGAAGEDHEIMDAAPSTEEPAETSGVTAKPPLSRTKTADLKHPTVDNPDGVVHFLLSELLSYREVDDITPPVESDMQLKTESSADVEMTNGGPSVSRASSTAPTASKKADKPDFKAEQHPIYIYRCLLLQCLSELLASYNRAKIEFINFSRKSDPKESTPSKPRSGVLNYLLNTLIPVGTLNTAEDVQFRKNYWTSSHATNAIVSLVQKTNELPLPQGVQLKEYEDEPELIYIRKFVLEHGLKTFKDAQSSPEVLDMKYSRLLSLGNLFNGMMTAKPVGNNNTTYNAELALQSQKNLARIMFEKNFISALTSSIAEIDLNFPMAKRAVKYILKPLKLLTMTAVEVSSNSDIAPSSTDEDEISTEASSVSDGEEGGREQTPDLFRNSALGILEPNRDEDDSDSDDDDEDEDEEMLYHEGYDEEMDFEGEHDDEDVISEEDEEMGPIEGLPGDVGMDIEIDVFDPHGEGSDRETDEEGLEDDDDLDGIDEEDDEDGGEDLEGLEEADDDDEWGTEEEDDDGEGYPDPDGLEEDDPDGMQVIHVMDDDGPEGLLQRLEEGHLADLEMALEGGGRDVIDDGMDDAGDEDEDEEGEVEFEEEDILYEPEFDGKLAFSPGNITRLIVIDEDEGDAPGMAWDAEGWGPVRHEHGVRHGHAHHHHRHGAANPWHLFDAGELGDAGFVPPYRTHRTAAQQRTNDDGSNPLLRRDPGGRRAEARSDWIEEMPSTRQRFFPGDGGNGPVSFITNLINQLAGGGQGMLHQQQGGDRIHISIGGMHLTGVPHGFPGMERPVRFRSSVEHSHRTQRDDPGTAVQFAAMFTGNRWQEESRILCGSDPVLKAQRITNSILRLLVPPALEAQKIREQKRKEEEDARLKKEEEERIEREAQEKKELEERVNREAKERREREAAEAEEAARRASEQPQAQDTAPDVVEEQDQAMEDAEPDLTEREVAEPSEPAQRVVFNLRGREIDITDLGIDLEYLEALPEELREEVLMAQIAEHRANQTQTEQVESTEMPEDFLNALPPELREELLAQEAQDRRRREREEQRRRNAPEGEARAEDIDPASFLATLPPQLRQTVLMESDDDILAHLPEEIAAEARALGMDRRQTLPHMRRMAATGGLREALIEAPPQKKGKPRPVIQMLDKAGVATLLRLMFIPQSGTSKQSLHGVLHDVCQNKQNRAEVVSLLLSILQDGSNDLNAVEKSFAHLSIRAKSTPGPAKTPTQQLKRTLSIGPSPHANGEMSPMMVVQQCLGTLAFLTQHSHHLPWFFLTEHETGNTLKSRSAKKGKGKESKSGKYPLNALLGLLDRKLIIESSLVMEQLATLLQIITHPLNVLLKKEKDKQSLPEVKEIVQPEASATEGSTENMAASVVMTDAPPVEQPSEPTENSAEAVGASTDTTDHAATQENTEASESTAAKPSAIAEAKKERTLIPPEIPEHNLRLVVNILTARECNGKTFRETLTLITNLSCIPDAKEIFGKELVKQAQELGKSILADLDNLNAQIAKAKDGTDVQGLALAKFSPASSDQAKLLRVMTALDYLFDPKRAEESKPVVANIDGLLPKQKEDILTTLYENSTFGPLWAKLSECLTAIRQRGNMINVATILLPLIEVLMVVCKNTTLKDTPLSMTISQETGAVLGSPAPESRMESLFFNFTEEHRKVLNELVRHNPKLMSGSFSLLVKNSKVLEFDNKRNYFTRKLHARSAPDMRHPHAPLQLSVRRSDVFLDSYKSLYFKSGDEVKYGKLSIRFHGEEGVDAGGVTREWFQVLAKQMFNPDYALFIPVASDRTTFHPNPLSHINSEHLRFFKFIGRIIGKALYEGRVLDCHFSRAVYKRMLGKPVSIKDMESIDLDYYKSLLWMLENDITDIITETFSIEREEFGETKIIDLIENGRAVPVTEENKQEYVQRVVEYRMTGAVEEQLENFLQGFHDIVPAELISIFNEQELELLISGLPDIDIDDWKNNTEYHNYTAASPQIQWFWRAVRSFDKEERAKLLQFVTGTSKVPLNGFKELEGMNGFSLFNIHRDYGNKDRLPSSHTCFNRKYTANYT